VTYVFGELRDTAGLAHERIRQLHSFLSALNAMTETPHQSWPANAIQDLARTGQEIAELHCEAAFGEMEQARAKHLASGGQP
jgi:hypothetical protein